MYVDTAMPCNRLRAVEKRYSLQNRSNNENPFLDGPVEKYIKRPQVECIVLKLIVQGLQWDNLTIVQYFESYDVELRPSNPAPSK